MKVLVTGAYGNQGRALVPKLAKAGIEVRAAEFNPAAEDKLYEMGAKEVIIGDLRNDSVMERAMTGVDTVYLLLPSALPRVVGMSETMIELAEKLGIQHFVLSSCMNVVPELAQHWEKYLIESALMGSRLNYTILKPCGYMEVHFPPVPGGIFDTCHYTPLTKSASSSFISIEDITDVACKVITEGEPHYFASYDLCSKGHYDWKEVIALMQKCFADKGLTLQVSDPPLIDWAEVPMDIHAKDVNGRIAVYHTNHPYRGNSFVFDHLMGYPAKTLEKYFRDNIEKFHAE